MNKNVRFVGTLLAASVLSAGSAHAQTTNSPPRGVIGGTMHAVGLGGVAVILYSPGTYNTGTAPRGGLVRGLVGGLLRPTGGPAVTMGSDPSSGETSLPGLEEADSQMQDDASDEDVSEDGDANPDGDGDDMKTSSADAADAMGGAEGSRQSGSAQRTSSDYRGNREHTSRVFSVGVQVGRASTTSNEQQVRRGSRSEVRQNEAAYSPPPAGQNAEGTGDASGNGTGGTPAEGAPATASGEGSSPTGTSAPAGEPSTESSPTGEAGTSSQTASASDSTSTPAGSSSTTTTNASP